MNINQVLFGISWDGHENIKDGILKYATVPTKQGLIEFLHVEKGASLPCHKHHHSTAMVYVLEGSGQAIIGTNTDPSAPMAYQKGDSFLIEATNWHGFTANSHTILLAVQNSSTEHDTVYLDE